MGAATGGERMAGSAATPLKNAARFEGLLETIHLNDAAAPSAAPTARLGVSAPIPVAAPARAAPPARGRHGGAGGEIAPLGPDCAVKRLAPPPRNQALAPVGSRAGALTAPPRALTAREGRVYFDRRAFCVEPEAERALARAEADALFQLHAVVRRLAADVADREYARGGTLLIEHRKARPLDWREAKAPSIAEFEAIAAEAFDALPEAFRAPCATVAILVRDFPDRAQLKSVGLSNEFDLLGLYEGVDLTQESAFDAPQDLTRIFLFRRPLLDYWAEHDETLGALITHVLVHEIGHHFGLTDEQMQTIEDAAG